MTTSQGRFRRSAAETVEQRLRPIREVARTSILHGERSERRATRRLAERPSAILRNLLTKNPEVESFTIRQIVESVEKDPAASLMVFTIPSLVPIPGTRDLTGPSVLAVSGIFVGRRRLVRLPEGVLKRTVPRRALALAIHAVLPILERLEKMTRRRWSWLCTPSARRVIGVLVFLLALPLAFPILGFGMPHAASLFTIALGLMENDGAAVALGVTAGIASLVFFTGKNLSPRALIAKATRWINHFVAQLASARAVVSALLKRLWQWFVLKVVRAPQESGTRRSGAQAPHRSVPQLQRSLYDAGAQSGIQAGDFVAAMG